MDIKKLLIGLLTATSMTMAGCGGDDDGGGGGGTPCTGAYTETVMFTVACQNPLDMSALNIPVSVTAYVAAQPTAGDTFDVCVEADATLDDAIAQLIVDVSSPDPAQVDLASFDGDGTVTNGSPSTFPLTLGDLPQTIDFDPDGDGTGNGITLTFDPTRATVANDGSATTEISLGTIAVGLTDVPILGALDINIPSGAMDVVQCTLPDPLPAVVLDML